MATKHWHTDFACTSLIIWVDSNAPRLNTCRCVRVSSPSSHQHITFLYKAVYFYVCQIRFSRNKRQQSKPEHNNSPHCFSFFFFKCVIIAPESKRISLYYIAFLLVLSKTNLFVKKVCKLCELARKNRTFSKVGRSHPKVALRKISKQS